jgi:hypothetical protein
LGDGPHADEHLGITDVTPVALVFPRSDKGLVRPHLGPVHQAIEQTLRHRRQGFEGTHVQDALLFLHFYGWMTNRHLAIAHRLGPGG